MVEDAPVPPTVPVCVLSSRLLLSVSLLSLAAAAPALAQQAEPAATLDEVVVTAARTQLPRSAMPNTVEVIGEAEIAQQTALGSSAVETVAALIPSFSPTRQKLSGAGETLRGRSPLFLVDGVPQSTPLRDDSRDGFTIDPFFIDRVEVIFGSNAIQGVGATGASSPYEMVAIRFRAMPSRLRKRRTASARASPRWSL